MADDYGSMIARIEDEIADSTLTAQVKLAIQDAIKYYSRERWYFTEAIDTFATVASTQNYNLPSDFKGMERMRLTYTSATYWELTPRSFDYINNITTINTVTGPPQDYAIFAEQVYLYPIPNGVYTVTRYYNKQLTQLSADASTNAWMVDGEELIRTRAKWDLMLHLIREFDEADRLKQAEVEAYQNLKGSSTIREVQGRITPVYL